MTEKVNGLIKQSLLGEFDGAPKIQADSVCMKILSEYPEAIPPLACRAMRRVCENAESEGEE